MITVLITEGEYLVAARAIDGYSPDDARDLPAVTKVRAKLGEVNEQRALRLTNKEANVLMDALNECDDEAEMLSEKLTGRAT